MLKRVLIAIGKISLAIALLVVLYLIIALIFSLIPIKEERAEKEISLYLQTNGVHAELVLPIRNHEINWTKKIPFSSTASKDTNYNFMAIGWGNRNFYINNSFNITSLANAGLGLKPSAAIHITFYKRQLDNNCKKLTLSKLQYERLINYIDNSFQKDRYGNYLIINNVSYGNNDAFFEAKGCYSIFNTCNTWTNKALKVSNQRAALWTPFSEGILIHYR